MLFSRPNQIGGLEFDDHGNDTLTIRWQPQRSLLQRIIGQKPPQSVTLQLTPAYLQTPAQTIPLERIRSLFSIDHGQLSDLELVLASDQHLPLASHLHSDELKWLRDTIGNHIAKRKAALQMLKALR